MSDCLFCRIVRGEIPCTKVFEDEDLLAFRDIHPQAPVHVLFVPKVHLGNLNDLVDGVPPAVARIPQAAAKVARELGLAENGYRLVTNCGPDAGQTVFHLHTHLLGGTSLSGQMA